MVNEFIQYAMMGTGLMAGLEPVSEMPGFIPGVAQKSLPSGVYGPRAPDPNPSTLWRFGRSSHVIKRGGDTLIPEMPKASTFGLQPFMGSLEDYALFAGGGLQLGFAGLDIWRGYQEEGIKGAAERFNFQAATNAAIGRWAYTSQVGMTAGGMGVKLMSTGWKGLIGRSIGASIGGAIGESFLGMPGAWAGAYIGAAPIQALGVPGVAPALMVSTPFVIAAALKTAGYKGAYRLGQAGVARTAYRQRVDTDGSLAAFMTNNSNTMRARAVQAIRRSHSNARTALGSEATYFHTSKNFFSSYR